MAFFNMMNQFGPRMGNFMATYRCFPVAMHESNKSELEGGGKILLPQDALEHLSQLHIDFPMLFKLTNPVLNRSTHCGVLEFTAEAGRMYMPFWMMKNLVLSEGDNVSVECVTLQVATFAKFQPQDPSFLEIHNPKAVLENTLRNFSCLTVGDIIRIFYNDHVYELAVLELKPSPAVSIIETDMFTDFAPPVGYVEPSRADAIEAGKEVEKAAQKNEITRRIAEQTKGTFQVFGGEGQRISGKAASGLESQNIHHELAEKKIGSGIPNYDYEPGTLHFIRYKKDVADSNSPDNFVAFSGSGNTIKKKKR